MTNELIGCRTCTSPDCKGCNVFTLYKALEAGKFDALMSENHSLHDSDFDILERDRWIPCTERMPENQPDYSECAPLEYVITGNTDYDECFTGISQRFRGKWIEVPNSYTVTHWRALPEPPKEDA